MQKKYKYMVVCISQFGEQLLTPFVTLREAKRYVEPLLISTVYIVPRHDVSYYIEYSKYTYIKHSRSHHDYA